MRSPDATDVERIEGLLRGMPPETAREAHLEGMIRELRSVSPRASHELRERVRTLREPEVRRSLGWRPALVVIPVALAFAGAIILGGDRQLPAGRGWSAGRARSALEAQPRAAGEGRRRVRRPARADALRHRTRAGVGRLARARRARQPRALRRERGSDPHDARARRLRRLVERRDAGLRRARRPRAAHPAAPRAGRDRAVLRARHDHRPAGHGAGPPGRPRPAREADRLAADPARRRFARSWRRAVSPRSTGCGSSSGRQRLQGELNQQTRQRTGIANEVALAEFSLTLQTKRAAAVAGDSRIDGAVGDALEVLSVAAAVGLFLLIVLAPLAVIAVLLLLGRRSLRRREEERLLDQPRPTPTS